MNSKEELGQDDITEHGSRLRSAHCHPTANSKPTQALRMQAGDENSVRPSLPALLRPDTPKEEQFWLLGSHWA